MLQEAESSQGTHGGPIPTVPSDEVPSARPCSSHPEPDPTPCHATRSPVPAMEGPELPVQAEMVELVPNGKHAAALGTTTIPSLPGDR